MCQRRLLKFSRQYFLCHKLLNHTSLFLSSSKNTPVIQRQFVLFFNPISNLCCRVFERRQPLLRRPLVISVPYFWWLFIFNISNFVLVSADTSRRRFPMILAVIRYPFKSSLAHCTAAQFSPILSVIAERFGANSPTSANLKLSQMVGLSLCELPVLFGFSGRIIISSIKASISPRVINYWSHCFLLFFWLLYRFQKLRLYFIQIIYYGFFFGVRISRLFNHFLAINQEY